MRNRHQALLLVAGALALLSARDVSLGDEPTPAQVADLVDELRDPDAHVREVARRELVALGEKAVAPLVALVTGGEPASRAEAVQVLAALGPVARSAAPALVERVGSEKGPARLPFLRALGEIDPAGSAATAVPILLAFLEDQVPSTRLEAAAALRSFGPAASKFAPDVLAKIPSADPALRRALLETVRAMGVDAASYVIDLYAKGGDGQTKWLVGVVNELGEAIVPAAVKKLASEDKNVRAAAVQALGAVGSAGRGATPHLVAALKDEAGVVRRRAAEALGAVGADPKVALPALGGLLSDQAARAQVEAALAMGRVAVAAAHPGEPSAPGTGALARVIDDGLDWLDRHQGMGDDGLWHAAGFRGSCQKGQECGGAGETSYDVGVTALATLAFLGAGHTHQAGAHKDDVQRALKALREQQDADGCFGSRKSQHWIYLHTTAALAVTEAYRLTSSPFLREPASRGLQFIQKAQNPYLAWRYSFPPDGDNDSSVTGWAVRALASGRRAGFEVEENVFRNAVAWIDKMTEPEFGRTGYQQRGGPPARTNEMMNRFPPDKSEAITAEAICIRLDAGRTAQTDELLRKSADLVASKLPRWDDTGSVDLYYWFHGTDAMRRIGGASWEAWRSSLVSALAPHQERASAACARGSWAPDDPWGLEGGRVYSTSMALLSLEMCGSQERKAAPTAEVRAAVAALTTALESQDDAVRKAAQAALDDIKAAYR
jgi:HEAT repeat protein